MAHVPNNYHRQYRKLRTIFKGPLKFEKPDSEFTVHCRQCEKLLLEWDDMMFHDPSTHLIPREVLFLRSKLRLLPYTVF